MSNNSTIRCPNCRHEFAIGSALAGEIENEIKARYRSYLAEEQKKMEADRSALSKQAEDLRLQSENQERVVAEKLKLARIQLEEEANKKAAYETQLQVDALNKELAEKNIRLRESQAKEIELLQKEKAVVEREENLRMEMEKQMLERSRLIEEKARKMESEKFELKIKELEKKLEDQKELAEVMQRKAEQGSMQLQGETLEIALEELLRATYPFDVVEEVAKGVRGADCIQHVRNALGQVCGKIIYESKRTKAFAAEWLEKLKTDMRAAQADIAVIVTQTLPRDMEHFGFKDGVMICRFSEVKALSFLLRDTLIRVNSSMAVQENKGEKMQMLYDYLTGNEFRQNIEAVVEGFISLRDGITRERAQMEKLWKEREKQLDKVLLNTTRFYGSIKGIAGSAVGEIRALESS
jgi:hypothetical protein